MKLSEMKLSDMPESKSSKARTIFDAMLADNPNVTSKELVNKVVADLDMHPGAALSAWVRYKSMKDFYKGQLKRFGKVDDRFAPPEFTPRG